MSGWRDVTIADLCSKVDYGYTASSSDNPDLPRFLRITDIVGSHIDWRAVPGCEIDTARHAKFLLREGDIVVARTGATVGHAKRIRRHPDAVFASYLVRFRPSEGVDPSFLGAVMESAAYKEWVLQNAGGAAQPNANARTLGAFPLQVPDLATQRRIGGLLESINELLENNRRRVEVLEEMARAIYREWFVYFRYPGHEDVPLVDSPLGRTPSGWACKTIGDVLELRYGKALKKGDRRGGPVAVVSSAGIVGWHSESLVAGPVIVVGRKGNVGSITWTDSDAWPIDTAYFVESELPLRYVAEQLRGTEFVNTHAAVPGLSRDQAYSRPFLLPPRGLMERFDTSAEALLSEARILSEGSKRLVEIQDFLVPKLVTGQIDVSSLESDVLAEVTPT